MNRLLKKELLNSGASVVGFAGLEKVIDGEIAHLGRAVSIGVDKNLNEGTLRLLGTLQKRVAKILREKGYRYLCVPPDSDRVKNTFVSKLYPLITHKMVATSAGLGWIGRNGLLINPVFGPRLTLATVLTDAPLKPGNPVESCRCGECSLCMELCPSEAITGRQWSRRNPYVELISQKRCDHHKRRIKALTGKPNCGLCRSICPYGRRNKAHKGE